MTHLLVIGGPSLDTIHIGKETYQTIGGAGMYMSMAAKRNGVDVTLFGLKPNPVQDALIPFHNRLVEWMGPVVSPDAIARFEISHEENKAHYQVMNVDSERQIDLSTFPKDLSLYDGVHITVMGDAHIQKLFLDACIASGVQFISIGTWLHNVTKQAEVTRYLIENSQMSFMNREEAECLFGSLDAVKVPVSHTLYITLAEQGVLVFQGDHQTLVPARKITMKDPTGAGESFCGATVANVLRGMHPVKAAMQAVLLAAEKIADVGPNALMRDDPPPTIPLDPRVDIDRDQVQKVAAIVKDLSDADPFGFVGDYLPPAEHPAALDFFFAATFQQFGFWTEKDGCYHQPMIADIDGVRRKGSAYMFAAYNRLINLDPAFFKPQRQAGVTLEEMREIFRADDGSDPMPALELHVEKANAYGKNMLALGLDTAAFLEKAQAQAKPLDAFVRMLDHVGGYKEDPMRKKSNLLALIVSQRPEKFLTFGADEAVSPVVDYHCMRAVLRQGLVTILDEDLRAKIARRELLQPDEEWAVRDAAYRIQEQVEALTGKPIGAVDWFFFNYTRSHCPEMTDPVCAECAVDTVCAKRKELFQPVLRTTFY